MIHRIRSIFVVILVLAAATSSLLAAPPRLTVVVIVDQMRADYLQRFSRDYVGGFARLTKNGAWFTNARHGHVPTETAPGHAALLTGCFPDQNGIVANHWWDRTLGKVIYAVDDPAHGVSPANLMCSTLGDVLKTASPKSEVVSISGKDRAAILMGGHKPDLVLWYETSTGQFVNSSYYAHLPQWVLDWNAQLKLPVDQRTSLTMTPLLDIMTLALAKNAIEEEKLGNHGVPDLLTVSLSATDLIGHQKGPDSLEMHNQLIALDRELEIFLDYLDQRFGSGQYTFALSSDHGVLPVPESQAGKDMGAVRLKQADFTAQLEASLTKRFGPPNSSGKQWVLSVIQPNIYLNMPMAKAMGIDPEALRKEAARILKANPMIAQVFLPAELAAEKKVSGPFAAIFQRSFYPDRSGDVLILMKEGVLLSDYTGGTSHGLPYDYDARIPLVFLGADIRPGRYDQEALAEDLAPTLGRVLDVQLLFKAPSRVLKEALEETPVAVQQK